MAFLIIYKKHTRINKRSKKQHDEAKAKQEAEKLEASNQAN